MKLTPLTLFALFCLFSFVSILAPAYAGNDEHKSWDYPPFGATDVALYQAFQASCSKFASMDPSRQLGTSKVFGTAGQWQNICREGLGKKAADLEDYLHTRLAKVKLSNSGKFTGYYKPVLEGSRKRHGEYQTPLLAKPKDLTSCNGATGQLKANGQCLNPYPQRSEIMANLKAHKVLLWLKDPVDVYFLHIQGSGTVELDDGTVAHIGFAGKNGHPYVAIGKVLKDMGELKGDITADKIRDWLKANPKRNDEVLNANPSFIFFKETTEESPGAFGVQLTGGRSLAVDRSSVPLGLPVQVETTNTYDNSPWSRLMFAQDVGSAIKGPGRGDIYFGHGPLAGKRAGFQNATGTLSAYVPKENVGEQAVVELEEEKQPQPTPQATAKPTTQPQPQQTAAATSTSNESRVTSNESRVTDNDFQPLIRAPEQTVAMETLPAADSSTTQPDLQPVAQVEPAAAPEQAQPQPEQLAEATPEEETTPASPFPHNSPADKLARVVLKNVKAPNPLAD